MAAIVAVHAPRTTCEYNRNTDLEAESARHPETGGGGKNREGGRGTRTRAGGQRRQRRRPDCVEGTAEPRARPRLARLRGKESTLRIQGAPRPNKWSDRYINNAARTTTCSRCNRRPRSLPQAPPAIRAAHGRARAACQATTGPRSRRRGAAHRRRPMRATRTESLRQSALPSNATLPKSKGTAILVALSSRNAAAL